jgi:hypothetical protein
MPGASPNSKPSRSGQAKKRFQPAIGRDFGAVDEVETKSRGYLMRAIVSLNGGDRGHRRLWPRHWQPHAAHNSLGHRRTVHRCDGRFLLWAAKERHGMTTLSFASGATNDDTNDKPRDKAKALKKNRVQLDFPPRAMERLNTLKAKTEASSYAEVVKNALRLYEALIEEDESGKQFLTRDKDGVVAPFRLFL